MRLAITLLMFVPFALGCDCAAKKQDYVLQKEDTINNIRRISADDSASGLYVVTHKLGDPTDEKEHYLPKGKEDEFQIIRDVAENTPPWAKKDTYKDKNSDALKHKIELHLRPEDKLPGDKGVTEKSVTFPKFKID